MSGKVDPSIERHRMSARVMSDGSAAAIVLMGRLGGVAVT